MHPFLLQVQHVNCAHNKEAQNRLHVFELRSFQYFFYTFSFNVKHQAVNI